MSSARKSSAYIMASTFISKGIAFVGSIFIARLLFPEDFGYIVFAEIIYGFIALVANCGFENFYLQEKITDAKHEAEVLSVTYKLRLIFNGVLFLVQVGISFLVQYHLGEEIVGTILRILALGHLLNGITASRQYILRKKLDFRIESIGNVARDVVGTIAKVGFAFAGMGAVSIAVGVIFGGIARALLFLRACSMVPISKSWNRDITKRVFYFGFHSFCGNIGMYLGNYIDKILLTATFNKAQMGIYSFSYSRANMVKSNTTLPLGNLIISWIAKNKENKPALLVKIARFTYLETAVLSPIIIFLFVFSDWVIPFVFGNHWVSAVPLFRVFLVMQLISCLTWSVSNVLTGLGYPNLLAKQVWWQMITLTGSLWFVSRYENLLLYGVVFALVYILFAFVKAGMCLKKLEVSFFDFFRASRLGVLSCWCAIYCAILFACHSLWGASGTSILFSGSVIIMLLGVNHLLINRFDTFNAFEMIFPDEFKRKFLNRKERLQNVI